MIYLKMILEFHNTLFLKIYILENFKNILEYTGILFLKLVATLILYVQGRWRPPQ